MNAPDLTKKALGYRQFAIRDGGLCSTGVGNLHWLPGPNHARCAARLLHQRSSLMYSGASYFSEPSAAPARHAAPASGCNCGLYGLHDFVEDWLDGHMSSTENVVVVGAILGWGKMEVHRNGYRSEWAEVVLLGYDPWIGVRKIAEVQDVARIYGVRAVDLERFAEEAPKAGERVPENLLPEPVKSAPPPQFSFASGGVVPWQQPLSSGSGLTLSFNVDQGADEGAQQVSTRRVRSRSTWVLAGANLGSAVTQVAALIADGSPVNAAVLALNLLGALFIWFAIPTWREVSA